MITDEQRLARDIAQNIAQMLNRQLSETELLRVADKASELAFKLHEVVDLTASVTPRPIR